MGKKPKTPPPTAQEQMAGRVAVEQWNEYATRWHEPIMTWAAGVAKDKAPDAARATGIVNADLAQASAGLERRMAAGGMGPNSGRVVSGVADAADTAALAGAGAKVSAGQGVDDARLFGLQQVANIGMGQKTTAVDGLHDIAQQSVRKSLSEAIDKQQRRADTANFVGGMAGVAAGVAQADWKKPAGNMKDFDTAGQAAVLAGQSYGPGGYTVRGGKVYWND